MYKKNFSAWEIAKERINDDERIIYVRRCEIRWAILGVNIGSEMDGKGESFTRPVLIIHVVGGKLALVAPLSTKIKNSVGYLPFEWKNKSNALCIHQMRIISQKRLLHRLGKISDSKLNLVKGDIKKFYEF